MKIDKSKIIHTKPVEMKVGVGIGFLPLAIFITLIIIEVVLT